MTIERLVRVLEIPTPSGKFHFGGGEPQQFVEVDWFRHGPQQIEYGAPDFATAEGRAEIERFIRAKRYFRADRAYLVLHPDHPFTINYDPDEMIRRDRGSPPREAAP